VKKDGRQQNLKFKKKGRRGEKDVTLVGMKENRGRS
jgi:hypothetical protein